MFVVECYLLLGVITFASGIAETKTKRHDRECYPDFPIRDGLLCYPKCKHGYANYGRYRYLVSKEYLCQRSGGNIEHLSEGDGKECSIVLPFVQARLLRGRSSVLETMREGLRWRWRPLQAAFNRLWPWYEVRYVKLFILIWWWGRNGWINSSNDCIAAFF